MKKVIVTILAFIYLGVSSGVAMEIHYCMGKKAGVEFYSNNNDKCGKCGMKEKKGGCCNDEHKFYKLNDSHKNVSNDLSFETPVELIESNYPAYHSYLVSDPVLSNFNNHSPPEYSGPSTFILNCIFRL